MGTQRQGKWVMEGRQMEPSVVLTHFKVPPLLEEIPQEIAAHQGSCHMSHRWRGQRVTRKILREDGSCGRGWKQQGQQDLTNTTHFYAYNELQLCACWWHNTFTTQHIHRVTKHLLTLFWFLCFPQVCWVVFVAICLFWFLGRHQLKRADVGQWSRKFTRWHCCVVLLKAVVVVCTLQDIVVEVALRAGCRVFFSSLPMSCKVSTVFGSLNNYEIYARKPPIHLTVFFMPSFNVSCVCFLLFARLCGWPLACD